MKTVINTLRGSGQTGAFPDFEAIRGAVSALSYTAKGVVSSVYGKDRPAAIEAANILRRALEDPAPKYDQALMRRALAEAGFGLSAESRAPQGAAALPAPVDLTNHGMAEFIARTIPLDAVMAFLAPYEPRKDLGETRYREIFGSMLLELANQQNASLYEVARKAGLPLGPGGSAGVLDKFARKVSATFGKDGVGQVFREQVQTKIGEFLVHVGQSVLKLSDTAVLGTFFLQPLGFTAQAQLIKQIGRVLVDGSINAFDEKALARSTAVTLRAAGQAMLIAGSFPSPYSALFIAIGTLSIAAGKIIDTAIDAQEAARLAKLAPGEEDLVKRATVVVNAGYRYGYDLHRWKIEGYGTEPAPDQAPQNAEEQEWFIAGATAGAQQRAREVAMKIT